eukprot:scaffold6632_cov247-Chaetoceros_neogracile.AAC.1
MASSSSITTAKLGKADTRREATPPMQAWLFITHRSRSSFKPSCLHRAPIVRILLPFLPALNYLNSHNQKNISTSTKPQHSTYPLNTNTNINTTSDSSI